ncbi:MAG: hypothetical protein JO320_23265 [Alphaproteobacteria bacterium]|nr:hypothetical protein [Alphaproteobacteria bacterium]MBV9377930.1 hypothetical protein [Alphaproteobacteria bacterium]
MRVARRTASCTLLGSRPVIGNTAAFVRGVLLRHGGRRPVLQPLDRAFRRPFFAMVFARHTHRHDQRTNLRIGLALQPLLRRREIVRPFVAWRAAAPGAAAAMPPQRSPDLVTRILARERRVESVAAIHTLLERIVREHDRSRPVGPVAPMPAPPAPAVPMIIRRPAAPPLPGEASRPHPHGRSDVADWGVPVAPPRPAVPSAPIPFSPTELSRLTDHVVRAIDHRFTAHRERHGRI